MKRFTELLVSAALVILLLSTLAEAGRYNETIRSFDAKRRVKIKTVSGNCIVEKGEVDKIEVKIRDHYRPRGSFRPDFRETEKTLILTERILESNSGYSEWSIRVPDGIEIDFSSASGNLTVYDLDGDFSASTASGDVEIEGCRGNFEFNTASGNILATNCHGWYELNTASGDIRGTRISIESESDFNSASGNVRIDLAESPEYDLQLGSASGKSVLSFGGNPVKGFFEFIARYDRGRIKAPYDFDDQEIFRRHGDKYIRKTFVKETDEPRIKISTASGRAELK
jgi:hypothetical protein